MQAISGELAIILGVIALIAVAAHGIVFSNTMIREDLREKERQKMLKEGLFEKQKRLSLSGDGELVNYDDYLEGEYQRKTSSNNR